MAENLKGSCFGHQTAMGQKSAPIEGMDQTKQSPDIKINNYQNQNITKKLVKSSQTMNKNISGGCSTVVLFINGMGCIGMKYTCRVKYRAPYSANDLEVEEKMISIYMYMTQCLSPHLNSAAIEDLNRSAAHWERLLSDKPPFLLLLARQLSVCICISKCAFSLQLSPILSIEVFLSTRPPEFFSQPPITRPEQEPSLST